jgi:hypothetical protein
LYLDPVLATIIIVCPLFNPFELKEKYFVCDLTQVFIIKVKKMIFLEN